MDRVRRGIGKAVAIIISVIFLALMFSQIPRARKSQTEPVVTIAQETAAPEEPEETAEPEAEQMQAGWIVHTKLVLVRYEEITGEEKTPDPEPEPEEPERTYVYYDVPLDDELQEYTQDICAEYAFPCYDIIVAMIWTESGYTEDIVSSTNDWGYMQINGINHQTLREELGITDFLDGEQNILAGVYMIQKLYHKYGDIGKALMAYNCGEYGAAGLWEEGIYSTNYSRTIQKRAGELTIRQ